LLAGEATLGADDVVADVGCGNAIHLTSAEELFTAARGVLRLGGAIAVIANGTPL
jgi:hypothetical protein